MNLDEAKHLLQLCRPDHPEDLQDPAIAEAFALCATHPELRTWFEAQQAFDRQMSQSIDAIPVPDDLEASILAGMRVHEATTSPEATDTAQTDDGIVLHQTSRSWWLRPWIGIAAVLALLLTIVLLPRDPIPQISDNSPAAPVSNDPELLRFLEHQIEQIRVTGFDLRDEDPRELQSFLAAQQAPSPLQLPVGLVDLNSIGCRMLDYQGTKLSIICFRGESVYHLITADMNGFPIKVSETPQIFELENLSFKLWSEGNQVQMLAVQGTEQDLPELI